MGRRIGSLALILACSVTTLSIGGSANAQFGAAIAVVGGGLVLEKAGDEFRESIDHAYAAASSLLGQADKIAKERLAQIDEIANRTIMDMIGKTEEAARRILADATKMVNDLEKQIMADVKQVIWEAECAGKRIAIGDLGVALGGLGRAIGTNQIRITPPVRVLQTPNWYAGCFWWCRDPYVVDVTEPFGETYKTVRDLMEEAIAPDQITEDTPADNLVGTYEYLSSFAKKTSCFYQGSEDRYNRAFVYYQDRAKQWNNLVDVKL
jgi:gas vesicle protein